MYDHIGLKVKDLDAAVSFYRAALAPLGHLLDSRDATNAGFGPPGAPALWLYRDAPGAKIHVAFRAADRRAVDRFIGGVRDAMTELRKHGDKLETLIADDLWPLPTYREMLFIK